MSDRIPETMILNVRVSCVSKVEALAWICVRVEKREKAMVVTPNPEQVVLAQKDRYFRKILNASRLALADGGGLLWASWFLQTRMRIRERVTGEEMMFELLKLAGRKKWKVFLLGGQRGRAERAAEIIDRDFPGIRVEASSGAAAVENESREERKAVVSRINSLAPDILFVAYGAPRQEKWLFNNFGSLDIGVGMVVGGALDMIVDPTLRPPKFMSRLGMDWLYRLLRQPWRITRQISLVKFVYAVLRKKFKIVSRGRS